MWMVGGWRLFVHRGNRKAGVLKVSKLDCGSENMLKDFNWILEKEGVRGFLGRASRKCRTRLGRACHLEGQEVHIGCGIEFSTWMWILNWKLGIGNPHRPGVRDGLEGSGWEEKALRS